MQPLTWHRLLPGPPGLVVGYAAHTPDRLAEAVRRLAESLGAAAAAAVGAGLTGR